MRVKRVYKLSSDYQEMFINNASQTITKYDEVALSQRTIHKDYYDDIYILEPSQYYKIDFDYKNVRDKVLELYQHMNGEISDLRTPFINFNYKIKDKLMDCGLIISNINEYVYLYNASDNMVFLQKDAIIGSALYG